MPFDSNKAVEDRFSDACELTQEELEAVSGGKKGKPPADLIKVEIKQVLVSSYD